MRKMRVRLTHPNNVTLYTEKGASSTVSLLIYNFCGENFHFHFSPLQRGFSPAFVHGEASRFFAFPLFPYSFLGVDAGRQRKGRFPRILFILSPFPLAFFAFLAYDGIVPAIRYRQSRPWRVKCSWTGSCHETKTGRKRRGAKAASHCFGCETPFCGSEFPGGPRGPGPADFEGGVFLCLRRRKRPGRTDIGHWR